MCAWRFKITVARRQHSNLWRRSGTDDSGIFLTFLSLSARTESKQKAATSGGLRKVTMECFLHPRPLLAPSAQLLGFCLFSTLEMIVGLHEEKPRTLPIADRTCLL
jgi:hypothetical protein